MRQSPSLYGIYIIVCVEGGGERDNKLAHTYIAYQLVLSGKGNREYRVGYYFK